MLDLPQPLDIKQRGSRSKTRALRPLIVGGAFGKQNHPCGAGLPGAARRLHKRFNSPHGIGGRLQGMKNIVHAPPLARLDIAVPYQPSYGPPYRIAGTLKLFDKRVFGGQQISYRIFTGFNPFFQHIIDLRIFILRHGDPLSCANKSAVSFTVARPSLPSQPVFPGETAQKKKMSFRNLIY